MSNHFFWTFHWGQKIQFDGFAHDFFSNISGIGFPTVQPRNAMQSSLEKSSQWQFAMELLNTMEVSKVQMDVITFSSVMSALGKSSQWPTCLHLFKEMMDSRI